jgi:outer membrane receptor protein involved in Fe transport
MDAGFDGEAFSVHRPAPSLCRGSAPRAALPISPDGCSDLAEGSRLERIAYHADFPPPDGALQPSVDLALDHNPKSFLLLRRGESMAIRKLCAAVLALSGIPAVGFAQSSALGPGPCSSVGGGAPPKCAPAPAQPSAEGKTVQGVTVTAAEADIKTAIDRRRYNISRDLRATSGPLADALRNIPSVGVDLEGNVTLRGDGSVTILVDGKPSTLFSGPNRATALQQVPADQFASVEVMTTPSADQTAEGGAGIINLITKRIPRGTPPAGSAYATLGSAGLRRGGVSFGLTSGKLTLSGNASDGYSRAKTEGVEERIGDGFQETIRSTVSNRLGGPTIGLTGSIAASPKTQITGQARYTETLGHGENFSSIVDSLGGLDVGYLERVGWRRYLARNLAISGGFRHTFGPQNYLTFDFSESTGTTRDRTKWTVVRANPVEDEPFEDVRTDTPDQGLSNVRVGFGRRLGKDTKLDAGVEYKADRSRFENVLLRGADPDALAPVLDFTNDFKFRQEVGAAFATVGRSSGQTNLQAGLRLETAHVATRLLTTDERDTKDYTHVFPSVHLTHRFNRQSKISFGYSERVIRPPAQLLNPFQKFLNKTTIQQGNPDLDPVYVQSYEVGYERTIGKNYYLATAYYRIDDGIFSSVIRGIDNDEYLITFASVGKSSSRGVELVATGTLAPNLTYNANANIYRSENDSTNLPSGDRRAITGVGGRANLNWQATSNDLLQINVNAFGKRLLAEGVQDPIWMLNLGWRHKFSDRLSLILTVEDPLGITRYKRVTRTSELVDRVSSTGVTRSALLRLDYRFGGGRPRDVNIEYNIYAPTGQ